MVTLKVDLKTLTNEFKAGNRFFVLGSHGTMVRLSRTGDRAKLITPAENVGLAGIESPIADTVKFSRKYLATVVYDTPHTDASGASREILIATILAGKDSGKVVMHLTPAEELEYNAGMAKLAEMYPG